MPATTFSIEPVPCLQDNYAYLLHSPAEPTRAWVVDPSEAAPIQAALADRGMELVGILATHHHHDHVGGISQLVSTSGPQVRVLGFADDAQRIPNISDRIAAPRRKFVDTGIEICGSQLEAMHIPGHTTGAIAWKLDNDVFTGDTLFAAGCGRLFEGTPAMMHESLRALCELDPGTRLWFGHEYTAANLRFASHIEPDNQAVIDRAASLSSCTTPSTVALELATNPFVRARDADEFGAWRRSKDSFRG